MASVKYELVEGWSNVPPILSTATCRVLPWTRRIESTFLTRMQARVIVYERSGCSWESFGDGIFTDRTHGIYIDRNDFHLHRTMMATIPSPSSARTANC